MQDCFSNLILVGINPVYVNSLVVIFYNSLLFLLNRYVISVIFLYDTLWLVKSNEICRIMFHCLLV